MARRTRPTSYGGGELAEHAEVGAELADEGAREHEAEDAPAQRREDGARAELQRDRVDVGAGADRLRDQRLGVDAQVVDGADLEGELVDDALVVEVAGDGADGARRRREGERVAGEHLARGGAVRIDEIEERLLDGSARDVGGGGHVLDGARVARRGERGDGGDAGGGDAGWAHGPILPQAAALVS